MAFPDLRVHRAGMREEGFWPSFTDIMMVIVMIFLMAMLGLLLRNMDLVARLKATLAAAQQAAQKIARTTDANRDLSNRLVRSEHELEMLRAQLMDSSRQRRELERKLDRATAEAAGWRRKAEAGQKARQAAERRIGELEQALVGLRSQVATSRAEAAQAAGRLQQQALDLERLRRDLAEEQRHLRQMRDDYSDLEAKYRRLIRPARSSLGKVVVSVRYRKQNGVLHIALQEPGAKAFTEVDSVELHRRLSRLKQRLGRKLYVRILFPDDSGLSYNEAWRITESLLRMYDYYYQEGQTR
ncbi:MAG: hypothetical protein D6682_08340 [Zetaproteobacteria bacterium]|nr:MAG: hypothetical protein D6682_08340 [Zetaproteobacteria bacterium]